MNHNIEELEKKRNDLNKEIHKLKRIDKIKLQKKKDNWKNKIWNLFDRLRKKLDDTSDDTLYYRYWSFDNNGSGRVLYDYLSEYDEEEPCKLPYDWSEKIDEAIKDIEYDKKVAEIQISILKKAKDEITNGEEWMRYK